MTTFDMGRDLSRFICWCGGDLSVPTRECSEGHARWLDSDSVIREVIPALITRIEELESEVGRLTEES